MLDVDLLDRAARRRTPWPSSCKARAGRCVRQKSESALGKALSLPGGLGTSVYSTSQQAARSEPQQSLPRNAGDSDWASRMTTLELIEVAEGRWLAADCCTAATIGSTFTGLPTGPGPPPLPAHPRSGGTAVVGSPVVGNPFLTLRGQGGAGQYRRRGIWSRVRSPLPATRQLHGELAAIVRPGAVNRCRVCGASLEGRRRQALTCSASCRRGARGLRAILAGAEVEGYSTPGHEISQDSNDAGCTTGSP